MAIHFTNVNSAWASILVETLYRLGLKTAIVCPGSRSAPLAIAVAQHPHIEAIPVLDERSAAFFALGIAQQFQQPVALICTSGTAGANFYPAVIEAKESQVPLLVLTADRPPELRDCNAGQAIDQQKLYGAYPNWYHELATPALDFSLFAYVRQTVIQAWERSLYPVPGCVHLNLPFRDPLVPLPQADAQEFGQSFDESAFFDWIPEWDTVACFAADVPPHFPLPFPSLSDRGLIVAGVAKSASPHASPQLYCQSIAQLAQILKVPVLAEGLSPMRNHAALNPYLVSTYDFILRNEQLAEKLAPDWIIRIGEMPTSKELRQWITQTHPRQWVIAANDRNVDPLHGQTTHLRLSVEQFALSLFSAFQPSSTQSSPSPSKPAQSNPSQSKPTQSTPTQLNQSQLNQSQLNQSQLNQPQLNQSQLNQYCQHWLKADESVRRSIDQTLSQIEPLVESKVAWILSQHLPKQTPLFIANSTPVRDVEWFWKPGNTQVQPFFNRGANGIDGTLSTALGIAHQRSGVLLTGDLALLHDTNGFLLRPHFQGHLTIVLINNHGGGIFELLPISQFDPPFEAFFATPQAIDFAQLCQTYGIKYQLIQTWKELIARLNPLPQQGIRVLEIRCDRKASAQWRKAFFSRVVGDVEI
jgi:2-succinyl-5-enolpyruvyl-6-hydroxy-3-cyclohexene-1-carboxylate synthase